MFSNRDTWLRIVFKTSLLLCLSGLVTERIMKLHQESSVLWGEHTPKMELLIATIMDSMVVCTRPMEAKSNSLMVLLPLHTHAKTTTTSRAFKAHRLALPSEELEEAKGLSNLTLQRITTTVLMWEAVITISMCQGTLNRHLTRCLIKPYYKAQAYNKIQSWRGANWTHSTNSMNSLCNPTRRGKSWQEIRTTWFFIHRCGVLYFQRTAKTTTKRIALGTLLCLISMKRGQMTIIITLNSRISRISRIWSCKTTSNHFRKRSKTLKISWAMWIRQRSPHRFW